MYKTRKMTNTEDKIAYIATESTIAVVLNGQNRMIQIKSVAHRNDVILALERFKKSYQTEQDLQDLEIYLAPIRRIVIESDRRFELDPDGRRLFLVGTKIPIPGQLGDKILDFLENGLPVDPLVKFWESCLRNPHYVAVDELFVFLTENHLPITDDGAFLGYKKLNFLKSGPRIDIPDTFEELIVGEDDVVRSVNGSIVTPTVAKKYLEFIAKENSPVMVDVHSETIKQSVGEVVRIERVKLNELDRREECGYGLHIGAYSYSFSGHVRVLCKVFPEDVIACNEGQAKLRTCKYQIVSFVDSAKEVKDLLVSFNKREKDIASGACCEEELDYEHYFNADETVKCVEEYEDGGITVDSTYYILAVDETEILVVDDAGERNWYPAENFESID